MKLIEQGNCEALKNAVSKQPVGAGMFVSSRLKYYDEGIYDDKDDEISSPLQLNHAVVIVGYEEDFWLVRNSWGKGYGENGYFRLKMGNTLNICQVGVYVEPHDDYSTNEGVKPDYTSIYDYPFTDVLQLNSNVGILIVHDKWKTSNDCSSMSLSSIRLYNNNG